MTIKDVRIAAIHGDLVTATAQTLHVGDVISGTGNEEGGADWTIVGVTSRGGTKQIEYTLIVDSVHTTCVDK